MCKEVTGIGDALVSGTPVVVTTITPSEAAAAGVEEGTRERRAELGESDASDIILGGVFGQEGEEDDGRRIRDTASLSRRRVECSSLPSSFDRRCHRLILNVLPRP